MLFEFEIHTTGIAVLRPRAVAGKVAAAGLSFLWLAFHGHRMGRGGGCENQGRERGARQDSTRHIDPLSCLVDQIRGGSSAQSDCPAG